MRHAILGTIGSMSAIKRPLILSIEELMRRRGGFQAFGDACRALIPVTFIAPIQPTLRSTANTLRKFDTNTVNLSSGRQTLSKDAENCLRGGPGLNDPLDEHRHQ